MVVDYELQRESKILYIDLTIHVKKLNKLGL